MNTPSLHSLRDVAPTPKGASPLAGETPATSIAGLACCAASRLLGLDAPRVVPGAMAN